MGAAGVAQAVEPPLGWVRIPAQKFGFTQRLSGNCSALACVIDTLNFLFLVKYHNLTI